MSRSRLPKRTKYVRDTYQLLLRRSVRWTPWNERTASFFLRWVSARWRPGATPTNRLLHEGAGAHSQEHTRTCARPKLHVGSLHSDDIDSSSVMPIYEVENENWWINVSMRLKLASKFYRGWSSPNDSWARVVFLKYSGLRSPECLSNKIVQNCIHSPAKLIFLPIDTAAAFIHSFKPISLTLSEM